MKKDYLTSLSKILTGITSTLNRDKIYTVALSEIRDLFSADAAMAAFVENDEGIDIRWCDYCDEFDKGAESAWLAEVKDFALGVFSKSGSGASGEMMELVAGVACGKCILKHSFEVGDRAQLGVLLISRAKPKEFTEEEMALFGVIANQFSVAVTNAKIFEEVLREGLLCTLEQKNLTGRLLRSQEEERKRIARELHDDTCQALSNVVLRMDMFCSQIPSDVSQAKAACKELKGIVTKALDGVHQMAFDLRPSMLDDLGLVPAIRWYTKEFTEQSDINVDLELKGITKKISSEREIVIFRIIQEALTNIRKHANTDGASVLLYFMDGKVIVEVEDKGKGFNVDEILDNSASRKALGILGMKERAELLDGKLTVYSKPGKKTVVKLEIPVSSTGEE
jgi:signal transduction histidine kinase